MKIFNHRDLVESVNSARVDSVNPYTNRMMDLLIANMNGDIQTINEKLIMFNQGKKYGQIVFLAGGAGSGKGFATKNFLEMKKFKIRDVDAWKLGFIELSRLTKNPKYSDKSGRPLSDYDLRNPADVFSLHDAVKKFKVKAKTLTNLLKDLNTRHLPNILFDVTLKDIDDIEEVVPKLESVGYDARNNHVVLVLANYHVAVKANKERERVVPDDILLKTHEGAASTMYSIIKNKGANGVNGAVHVILNNRENTIFWERPSGERTDVIKDFTYITLKPEGKPFLQEGDINQQILDWIKDNIPRTRQTAHLWGGDKTDEPLDLPNDFGDMEYAEERPKS